MQLQALFYVFFLRGNNHSDTKHNLGLVTLPARTSTATPLSRGKTCHGIKMNWRMARSPPTSSISDATDWPRQAHFLRALFAQPTVKLGIGIK